MKISSVLIVIFFLLGLLLGCTTPEQRAQTLFNEGKYEEILKKYPASPIAEQAKDKLAQRWLALGMYEEIKKVYPNTPTAKIATQRWMFDAEEEVWRQSGRTLQRDSVAESLYLDQRYEEVILKYPKTVAASLSRKSISVQLYAEKKYDSLISCCWMTPAGMKAREEMATAEWDRISKLSGTKRRTEIEQFMKDTRLATTDAYMRAEAELNKIVKA
jgi:hypothetical protein